jgi:ribonuclease P protein component
MTRRVDFDAAVRRGRRAGRPTLAVHAYVDPEADATGVRVGFVVSRAVGGAVVRNRVRRRLRHLVRPLLTALPPGTLLVVRAQPPAADATSAELAADLAAVLGRLRLIPADAA